MSRKEQTIESARGYLARGYQPLAVADRQGQPVKGPRRTAWQTFRCTESEAPAHFDKPCNVGLILGEPSGWLVDVDLDCPEAVALAPDLLPETGMVSGRAGNPSSHRWYRAQGATTTKWTDPAGGVLLEIRSTNAQTIVPPSIHEGTGEAVEWETFGEPATADRDALSAAADTLAACVLVAKHAMRPGTYHDAALAFGGLLLKAGRSADVAEKLVGVTARAGGADGWRKHAGAVAGTLHKIQTGDHVTGYGRLAALMPQSVIDRVCHWLELDPERWDPPIEFDFFDPPDWPVAILPPWLRSWVTEHARALQVPAELPAMLALATLSAAAGTTRCAVRGSWVEGVNLWVLVVLPPAERKSPVFSAAVKPLAAWEAAEAKRLGPEIAAAESRLSVIKQRIKFLEAKSAKSSDPDERLAAAADVAALSAEALELDVPKAPKVLADDITPEALGQLLAEQDGRAAIMSAEGGFLAMLAGRYSSNGTPNLDTALKAHAGDAIKVRRVGRDENSVERPALVCGLAVQPDVLRMLTANSAMVGRGLLARFLFALPRSRIGRRNVRAAPRDQATADAYADRIKAVCELPQDRQMALTPEADAALLDFEEALEPRMGRSGDLEDMGAWAGKLAGAVVRLAALLAIAWAPANDPPTDVTATDLGRAIVLAETLVAHAEAALSPSAVGDGQAQRLLAWIGDRGLAQIPRRDVQRSCPRPLRPPEVLTAALGELRRRGYVQLGGDPPMVTVNPCVWP